MKINNEIYREVRCPECKAFVVYDCDLIGTMAKQCDKCGTFNKYTFKQLKTSANLAKIDQYLIETKRKGGK